MPPARTIASTRLRLPERLAARASAAARRSARSAARCPRRRTRPARVSPGSSRLRPSMISGFAIDVANLAASRGPCSSSHSVTITAACAPRTASATLATTSTPFGSFVAVGDRVPGAHLGAFGEEPRREDDRRRFAHVVRVRLEREAEQRDLLAAQRAEVALQLPDHPPLLQLVHLDHRGEQLEVVARVGGELLERQRVLREARAAVTDAGAQEVRAEPAVEPDAFRDLHDVGARSPRTRSRSR